jgi:pimeloyl-ACP methyl ester carboxylesterase
VNDPEILLLPGLDGTGELFAPLLAVMPPGAPRRVLSYPGDRELSYEKLLAIVTAQMPGDRPVVLVAESFSGPLALWYAAAHPDQVRAVVLCASFVCSPVPRCVRFGVHPWLFRLPLPSLGVRLLLVGSRTPGSLVKAVKAAIARVRPEVLAHRVRQVMAVDCANALAECSSPVLYLRAEQDVLVRAGSVNRLLAIREDLIIRSLPGPHLLLQTHPAEAWREISGFLSQSSRQPQAADVDAADQSSAGR